MTIMKQSMLLAIIGILITSASLRTVARPPCEQQADFVAFILSDGSATVCDRNHCKHLPAWMVSTVQKVVQR